MFVAFVDKTFFFVSWSSPSLRCDVDLLLNRVQILVMQEFAE